MMKFAVFAVLLGAAIAAPPTGRDPSSTRPRRNAPWVPPPPPPLPAWLAGGFAWPPINGFNNIGFAAPPQTPLNRPWGSHSNVEDHGIQNRWDGTTSWLNDHNVLNSKPIWSPPVSTDGKIVWAVGPSDWAPPAQAPWNSAPQWNPNNFLFRSPLHGVYFD